MRYWVLALLISLLATGCEDKKRPAVAPEGDANYLRRDSGFVIVFDAGTRDSSLPMVDGSSALTDGGETSDAGPGIDASGVVLPRGCVVVPPGSVENQATATQGPTPLSFPVNFGFAGWDTARCSTPRAQLLLSPDSCVPEMGTQLLISMARDEIGVGIIRGTNMIQDELVDDRITVRFLRPDGLGGFDRWGTCTGATGNITFTSDIDTLAGSVFTATFNMTLTDCAPVPTEAAVTVGGRLDLVLPVTYGEVCL